MSKYPFPKIDLHCHLDGSFNIETVFDLANKQGIELPGKTLEGYKQFLVDCSNADSVNDYLKMFDDPLKVMQDKESITLITKEVIERLDSEGLTYVEIRFAPQLHTQKGLSQEDATEAVIEGYNQAKSHVKVKVGFITCMMCVGDEKVNWDANAQTIEVCKKYLGKGVVGIDFAGAEGIVPLSNFKPLFDKINEYHLPLTCHAGDSQDWKTVEDAISFNPIRIGHGHHIYENPELCRIAAEKGIALEICPTSNVQCKTRESYKLHPAQNLLNMGIPVTINTDNPTLTRSTLEEEYDHCLNDMDFEEEDLILMNINSVRSSFMPENEKEELIKELEKYL